ncbi:MAG: putative lipid II flippase FtsW [Clostridiales bacterium]|nr:putative lipid II flippase FtsW [Clostridiales bacterium]
MPRKAPRDYTMAEQLARGPLDLPFLMLTMMLLGIGLVMMFSASYAVAYYDPQVSSPYFYIKRQASFAVGGIIIMMIVSHINYQSFRWLSVPAIVGSIFFLVLVYTPLGRTHNQARRWLKLGIEFQPSELAKVAVILFFAAMLCKRDTRKPRHWKNRTAFGRTMNFLERIGFVELLPYGAILGVIALLVVKQPHLSGTLLILAGGASVLFAAGIHWGWFVAGISFVSAAVWFVITNTAYMTDRINLWLDPWADFRGNGWQTCQSLLAMGSGGLFGVGLGNSKGKFDYVSESENDFVFSILVEELGYIGGAIVLILFALLILRGYWLALHARDKFGTLTTVGIITLLAVQVFLNIGVVTNLIPNTGISLPFFSYGGTALMIHMAEMGIVLSISRQIPAPKND